MSSSSIDYSPGRTSFGLLPEPEGRSLSFVISSTLNTAILVTLVLAGLMAKHVIQQHYEMTELVVPSTPPPPEHIKRPPPQQLPPPPQQPKIELQPEMKKIELPKPKPEPKPVQMEAKVNMPVVAKQQVITLAPQPKAALGDAMPAQNKQVKATVGQVHFGDTFGATPNPNSTRPATIAAIGNPYGGNQGPAIAPHGVVGSTGMGTNTRSTYGVVGKVASAGIPGTSGTGNTGANYGKVGSAGIPAATTQVAVAQRPVATVGTDLEVLSKPPVQYTAEARQLKVQGDVVLRVTFLASGQVVVQSVVHGLGHGLDQEACRVAQQIRFRPATRDGKPVDITTTITISFQLA
jgi:TonB family protein